MRWAVLGIGLFLVIVGMAGGANPSHTVYGKPTLPAALACTVVALGGGFMALALVVAGS